MELKYDPVQPLDLRISLMMGQAFRWQPEGEWFSGVVRGSLINIRKDSNGSLEFYSVPGPDAAVAEMLRNYLRLDEDINATYREISRDAVMAELVERYRGLRILRQEPWECLVAYILSARSPIPRIRQNVKTLSHEFGDCVYQGTYAFH